MAGYTDYVWRIMAARMGAGLVCSEMVAVEGLFRAHKRTIKYVENSPEARPFCIQLFGTSEGSFAASFEKLQGFEFDMIDINMGCPVKKVVARGSGAALMRTPKQAEKIIKAVRKVYSGPLSAKIRSGWDDASRNAVEMARIIEGSGADAVIVHGRTKAQGYTGHADLNIIRAVKEAVKIRVVGNGDVMDKESADKMFTETSCDGIMIGRASLANPFIFRTLVGTPLPTLNEKFGLIYEHIRLAREREDARHTMNVIRKFIPKYLKGQPDIKLLLGDLSSIKDVDVALDRIKTFQHSLDRRD
jgi:nifR3 family TIM-barrel protein